VLAVLVVAGALVAAWSSLDPGVMREPIPVLTAARSALRSGMPPGTAASAAPSTPPAEGDPGLVEVCGLGWVEKNAESGAVDRRVLAQIPGLEAAGEALIGRMQQSPDPFAQAAAMVIEAAASSAGDVALLHDEVARLASTTSDPRLYAIAFHACAKTSFAGNCALLSAAQWARIDAGNGQPWLFVLGDAVARDDRAMIDEALFRIGNAARIDGRFHALAGAVVAQERGGDVDLMAAQLLAMESVGIAAAWTVPLQALTGTCRGAAVVDANRRQTCETVATALAERSDSMLMTQIGATIGAQLAWPVERVAAVRALQIALVERWSAVPDYQALSFETFSCAGARYILTLFGRLAEVGEPQATRDWIAASGKGFDAFVSEARAHEARRSADTSEKAASAAARGS